MSGSSNHDLTLRFQEYVLHPGRPNPLGVTLAPGGINFAVYSRQATSCTLVLFRKGEMTPMAEIPFPPRFQVGHVFAMQVAGLDPQDIEYGYIMDGPNELSKGHRFDPDITLLDPYAKAISGRSVWAAIPSPDDPFPFRSRILPLGSDLLPGRQLLTPAEDLIIYEMHVRGLTRDPSSGVAHPGTFAAIREKIPYLKDLGINAIELMPIQEFDELDNSFFNPQSGKPLVNYWGYATMGYFAPKAAYAAEGPQGGEAQEFKALVNDLHDNGIEVILDIVFNHTGEGDENGRTTSFRGLENQVYYMLDSDGDYRNYSGTGNTMNCNHPVVRNLIIDCLRYWVTEYHIDGFRFDLASIMTRGLDGQPLENPPILEALAHDPVLGQTKLIAEAWDAAGLYQVGTFPGYGRFSEWNGRYRDTLRQFLKGDRKQAQPMARRIQGSPDMYPDRGPTASINFVTSHDGFTLADLVSYSQKHNIENGEDNRDGDNGNESWNWGYEGVTDNPDILTLRRRVMKNALAILFMSQGIPMILMGDEVAHSKGGNNNTYALDTAVNWFDWTLLESNADMLQFVKRCIEFRQAHPVLRRRDHLTGTDVAGSNYPDISWHGLKAWQPDWSDGSRTIAFLLCGDHGRLQPGHTSDDMIYMALNMHWEPHVFEIPTLSRGRQWHRFADTYLDSPDDATQIGHELPLSIQSHYKVQPRSVVILVGR